MFDIYFFLTQQLGFSYLLLFVDLSTPQLTAYRNTYFEIFILNSTENSCKNKTKEIFSCFIAQSLHFQCRL